MLLIMLAAVGFVSLTLQRESTVARAELAGVLASPTASLVRIKAYDSDTSISPAQVSGLAAVDGVAAVIGLSAPTTATSAYLPDTAVVVRYYVGQLPGLHQAVGCRQAVAPVSAAHTLRFNQGVGSIDTDGSLIEVVANAALPDELAFLEGSVLVRECGQAAALKELTIMATGPDRIDQVTAVALRLFPADQRSHLTVTSESDRLATAARIVQSADLSAGRLMTLVALAGTLLTTLLLSAAVVNRRRDFGRRRAIGASAEYNFALILGESLLITIAAMALTGLLYAGYAVISHTAAISVSVTIGQALMTLSGASLGAAIPAGLAARRDPLKEIRIP